MKGAALKTVAPIEGQTLGEQAYARMSDLLMSGRLAPGEKLSLRSAAEMLGVSMTPVREAVSRLVADHALEVMPSRAIRVPLMSVAQFRDLAQARIAIEGHAAAKAALNRSASDVKAIGAAEAAMRGESRLKNPDLARAVEFNKTFHFAVYDAAHSPTLTEIIRAMWLKTGPVLNLDLRANPERLTTGGAVRHHARVLAAIRAGDADGARSGIADDIGGAADFIISRGGLAD